MKSGKPTSPLLFTFYSQFAALCRIWRDISVTVVILHSHVVFGCHTRRYCADVLQRPAAARGAINSLMAELMGRHIRNQMPRNSKSSEEARKM
jgi:hypothetical protein